MVDLGPGCAPATWADPPACGSGPVARGAWIPGTADDGFDSALAAKARRHDRLFHTFFTHPTGVNSELTVPLGDTAARAAIDAFAAADTWDLSDVTELGVEDIVGGWTKVAGAYAGVGIAADAFRYGVLRDEGAACAEVDLAREHLLEALQGLHRAVEITGTPGVIARGYASTVAEGYGQVVETTPLFDGDGDPLPPEKDNGTWREDVSGAWSDFVWEDSCSRDMLMGWVFGFGAAWEVIRLDPTIPDATKATIQADAHALATTLLTVQESGYDLEIQDADGRATYHGVMNEQAVDRFYAPGIENGPYAVMSLGALAALTFVAEDDALDAVVADRLLGERALDEIARDRTMDLDFGQASNYSGHNMTFAGGLLAQRYLCDADAREAFRAAMDEGLYAIPGRDRQPEEQSQALYHLTAALSRMGGGAHWPASDPVDEATRTATLRDLGDFHDAPFWDTPVENCDADELEAKVCTTVDGKTIHIAGAGRNGTIVSEEPLALTTRPPSNYFWRSNPYQVNGGGSGATLYPAVDFRLVYWTGRWVTPTPRDPGGR